MAGYHIVEPLVILVGYADNGLTPPNDILRQDSEHIIACVNSEESLRICQLPDEFLGQCVYFTDEGKEGFEGQEEAMNRGLEDGVTRWLSPQMRSAYNVSYEFEDWIYLDDEWVNQLD